MFDVLQCVIWQVNTSALALFLPLGNRQQLAVIPDRRK